MEDTIGDIEMMRKKYSHNINKKKPTVNLKRLLKFKFPGIIFSVKLRKCYGSMYTFGDVVWKDGPSVSEVAKYGERFRAGGFSNDNDPIYVWKPTNRLWQEEFGSLEFIDYERGDTFRSSSQYVNYE